MRSNESSAHPWMANSLADIKQAMLKEIGAPSIEALFEQIPVAHRLKSPIKLPRQLKSEAELKRHLVSTLSRNVTCERNLSFLGAGCWQHHVPAVVDEIVGRTEFLTSVWGSPQSDHGRNQAWFEYASQLGELLEMDVVQLPVYSWGCAAGHAIRMAQRLTGRHEAVQRPPRVEAVEHRMQPDVLLGAQVEVERVLLEDHPDLPAHPGLPGHDVVPGDPDPARGRGQRGGGRTSRGLCVGRLRLRPSSSSPRAAPPDVFLRILDVHGTSVLRLDAAARLAV